MTRENRPGARDGSPSTIGPDTAYDRIVEALEHAGLKVKHSGGNTSAQCPTHDDNDPSLSLRDGDGHALVKCHAGCETRDVIHALGLTMSDLFDEDYEYDDGRKVHRRYDKDGKKTFRQSGNKNGTACLYRLSEVRKKVAAGGRVFVVEGEKDVHALESLGSVATCSPMGAGTAHKCDWTPLKGARIALIADKDAPGLKHAVQVRDILTGLDCQVDVFEAKTGKDISDHIAAGHAISETVRIELPEIDAAPDGADAIPLALDWHALWADESEEEWIVYPLLPARRGVALFSAPKVGKSLLTLEIAAAVATAREVLGTIPKRRRVLYVDFENDPRGDIRERLKAMDYGPEDLGDLFVLSFPTLAALDKPSGGQQLMEAVAHYGAELVAIDTVSRTVSGEENSNDTWIAFYRHTGYRLKQAGIAYLRLDHSGKDESKGQRGGSAKSGDVDAVWRLATVTQDRVYQLKCEASRFPIAEVDKTLTLNRQLFPLRHEVDSTGKADAFEARVTEVMTAMDEHGVPLDHGRDKVRKALKARGVTVRDTVLNTAIRRRKDLCQTGGNRSSDETCSEDAGNRSGTGHDEGEESAGQDSENLFPKRVEQVRNVDPARPVPFLLPSREGNRSRSEPAEEEKPAPSDAFSELLGGDA